jgi:hypothetical protein
MQALRRRRNGSFSVSFAMLLIPIIGFMGLVIDLSMAYVRRTELQGVADAAALAAARALDGTTAGIGNAKANAQTAAQANKYRFRTSVSWSVNALKFSAAADAPDALWLDAGQVNASNVGDLRFAKVDTSALDADHGRVGLLFMHALSSASDMALSARATAGRNVTEVMPLAICALNNTAYTSRDVGLGAGNHELVEYGFRRGVSYNLLNLNPNGATAKNYLINPIDFPGAPANALHETEATAQPFMCSGTLAAARVVGTSTVYVAEPFPTALIRELNSRFDSYPSGTACDPETAPPDSNIRRFIGGYIGWWMNGNPVPASAQSSNSNPLKTIADLSLPPGTPPPGAGVSSYGPLWSYTRPVRYDAAKTDRAGTVFTKDKWVNLYPAGTTLTSGYSDAKETPYEAGVSPHRLSPSVSGQKYRRVLNIPLLSCPVASGSAATVLAIGRFFMTAPATVSPAAVHGEFSGLASESTLGVSAALYK